jgi:thioesterase domain-containing protein
MAQQLREAGQRVELLCLFDPSPPRRTGGPPESEAELALGFARDLAGLYGVRLPADAVDLKGQPAREGMEKLFGRWRKAGLVPEDLGFDDLWERFEVYRWNVAAVYRYTPRPYAGTIALFPAERPRVKGGGGPDLPAAWRPVAASALEVLHIPGDHYTLLREPCVKALAHSLRSRLNRT